MDLSPTFVSHFGNRSKLIHRGVEQLVARRAHNPKVTGSSPVPATESKSLSKCLGFLHLQSGKLLSKVAKKGKAEVEGF